jgi:hypothetical protein
MSFFADFLPRKGAVYGGAAILLGLTPPFGLVAFAGDGKALQLPELSPRDWVLTNQARRVLQKDELLASQNVGVTVKDRVATVWGTLPSKEAVRRAEESLKKIAGVAAVVNECRIVPSDPVPQAVADAVNRIREQGGDDAGSAAPPASPFTATTRPQVVAKPPVETVGSSPPPPPAVLLAPVAADPRPADEPDALERVRRSEPRFKDVRLEAKGGLVKIAGTVPKMKDAWDLAEKLNALPGVRQVILGNVQEK